MPPLEPLSRSPSRPKPQESAAGLAVAMPPSELLSRLAGRRKPPESAGLVAAMPLSRLAGRPKPPRSAGGRAEALLAWEPLAVLAGDL